MAHARFIVRSVGPLVTIQDRGRHGFLRYGVPESGPMDRDAFEIAHAALGYCASRAAIEVSLGGIDLERVEGSVTLAVAGGGFAIALDKISLSSWAVVNVGAGSRVTIRPGSWGSWTYVAFAGRLKVDAWKLFDPCLIRVRRRSHNNGSVAGNRRCQVERGAGA